MSDDSYHLPQEVEMEECEKGFERARDEDIDIDQVIINGLTEE